MSECAYFPYRQIQQTAILIIVSYLQNEHIVYSERIREEKREGRMKTEPECDGGAEAEKFI